MGNLTGPSSVILTVRLLLDGALGASAGTESLSRSVNDRFLLDATIAWNKYPGYKRFEVDLFLHVFTLIHVLAHVPYTKGVFTRNEIL